MAEEREFVFEDWLAEGIKGIGQSVRAGKPRFLSEDFRTHIRAARREWLLAMRSLIDVAIERLEEPPRQQVTHIKVE